MAVAGFEVIGASEGAPNNVDVMLLAAEGFPNVNGEGEDFPKTLTVNGDLLRVLESLILKVNGLSEEQETEPGALLPIKSSVS